jgi:hypothetical protein
MKCPEPVFDRRSKKTRICNAEIYGMTGLQELQAFQKHMRKKHKEPMSTMDALEYRAESGQ